MPTSSASVPRSLFLYIIICYGRPSWRSFFYRLTEMGNRGTNKCLGDWFDNDEVCRNLKISKRTLQTLRDNGTLAYSQISHKTYYKQEDVQSVIDTVKDRKKDTAWRKPRKKSETKRDCVTPKD